MTAAYYIVRSQFEGTRVEGPCEKWQEACIRAFGRVDESMEIKCAGTNAWAVQKKSSLRRLLNEREGWFKPYLKGSEALGPPEIAEILKNCSDIILAAKQIEDANKAWDVANEYLRFIPLNCAALFSDLYNSVVAGLPRAGWRFFKCEECAEEWWETSRDRLSASTEICGYCGSSVIPSDTRTTPPVSVDELGNLVCHEKDIVRGGNENNT